MGEFITQLPVANTIDGSADTFPIVTSNINTTQQISRNTFLNISSQPLGLTDTQSPTNKTFNNTNSFTIKDDSLTLQNSSSTTKQATFSLSGITAGQTRVMTLPNYNATLASLTGVETLTNKTLTSPTITAPTITNATISADAITGYTSSAVGVLYGVNFTSGALSNISTITTTSSITAGSGLTMSGGTLSLTGSWLGWTASSDSWTYSSYDSTHKTGVITVPSDATTKYSVGWRIKFNNNSATQYGIITAITSTTLTIYFGTDYSLTNSSITLPFYSSDKAPLGFPADPTKWTVKVTNTSSTLTTIISTNTPVNDKSISINVPIGAWTLGFSGALSKGVTGSSNYDAYGGLDTANNTLSDGELIANASMNWSYASGNFYYHVFRYKDVPIISATTYYLNVAVHTGGGSVTAGFRGDVETTVVWATCRYL